MTEADLQLIFESTGIKELLAQTKGLNAAMEKLIAEGNKAEKEIGDVGRAGSKAGGEMGGLGKAMGGLGGILSGLGLAVGAAEVLNLGKSAIQSAINYETLSVQFEVFLGSAEKAKTVLADLNKFSIETPFTPDQVNAAGRSLLAFGVTAQNLIPTMKMIGDVSSAVGKDYNELATIFGKAKTAGTIFAEDINQLTEAGVPIIDELAKVFGITADKVKKLGSEGKIHFTDLEKAFANMTGEGGRFTGMMDKMSQSTAGLLSTIEGKLQDELRAIGTAMLPTIRVIAEGFEPAFASVKDLFVTIYTPIADAIAAFGELFSLFNIGGESGNKFANIVGGIASVLKITTLPAQLLWKAIGFIVEQFTNLLEFGGKVIARVGEIGNAFDLVLAPIKAVGAAWDLLFGDEATEQVGLSQVSMGRWNHVVEQARDAVGATDAQMFEFIKNFDRAKLAGYSQADAMKVVVSELNEFIHPCEEANNLIGIQTTKLTDNSKAFKFAAGSIGHYEEVLQRLQDRYKAVTTDIQRLAIDQQIQKVQFQLARFNNEVDRMRPIRLDLGPETLTQTEQLNAELEKMHQNVIDTGVMGQREGMSLADVYIQAGAAAGDFNDKLTLQGHLLKALGESGFGVLKGGLDSLKTAFLDFGASAFEAMGRAVGLGRSVGAAFHSVVKEMLVQVPKIAGMALIQAAAAPDVPSFAMRLGLLAGGLALMGLSGIVQGAQQKNQETRDARDARANMNGLQGSAIGGNGSNQPQGLAQFGTQMQPITINFMLDGQRMGQAMYPHLKDEIKRRG